MRHVTLRQTGMDSCEIHFLQIFSINTKSKTHRYRKKDKINNKKKRKGGKWRTSTVNFFIRSYQESCEGSEV